MPRYIYISSAICMLILVATPSRGQEEFIRTKEGYKILKRWGMIMNCLKSLHKDRSDEAAFSVCQCMVDKFDGHFTRKQYNRHTSGGVINISELIEEDTALKQQIQECYTASGKTVLLQAEGFEEEFVAQCKESLQKNTEKQLDPEKLDNFCRCQLQMVKEKKLTDAELKALSNPNSLLFYEVMYKCGNPLGNKGDATTEWTTEIAKDIDGPGSDTIHTLTIDGMTYVKIRIGSSLQVWLFDTGASDLLINTDMESALKQEQVITPASYRGTGEYEMANGMIDTCRKYVVNGVRIGRYTLNNVMVAVTDKGKRIIAGKGLLNKFSSWSLNNQESMLILNK